VGFLEHKHQQLKESVCLHNYTRRLRRKAPLVNHPWQRLWRHTSDGQTSPSPVFLSSCPIQVAANLFDIILHIRWALWSRGCTLYPKGGSGGANSTFHQSIAAMSLYYEAASFLSPASSKKGSLKSHIFQTGSNLKSSPATIYALISETAKYDSLLKEVIDNAGLLALESKVWRPFTLMHFD